MGIHPTPVLRKEESFNSSSNTMTLPQLEVTVLIVSESEHESSQRDAGERFDLRLHHDPTHRL